MFTRAATIAAEAVLRAGAIQKARYGLEVEVGLKGKIDLVTAVDRDCESAILQVLSERMPDADVITEETDVPLTGARRVWYVDPLDGTTNFAHGYPCFCASVALVEDGRPVAGAIFDPLRDELFTAARGGGAYSNGARMRVSSRDRLDSSLVATGFPYDVHRRLDDRLRLFNHMVGRARGIRRDGAAAIDLAYVACGRLDGFWEESLKPWDVFAGALMIEEAGGRLSRFGGEPLGLDVEETLASNGRIHDQLVEAISEARRHGSSPAEGSLGLM